MLQNLIFVFCVFIFIWIVSIIIAHGEGYKNGYKSGYISGYETGYKRCYKYDNIADMDI